MLRPQASATLIRLVLEREQTERKDSESSVGALKRQLASVKDKCNKVDIEIDQVKAAIIALRKGSEVTAFLSNYFLMEICHRAYEGRERFRESGWSSRTRIEGSREQIALHG